MTGLLTGGARGATVRLISRGGTLAQRYTVTTLLCRGASLAVSAGFGLLVRIGGRRPQARPLVPSIGVGMLGETLVLGLRASSTGQPFSPDQQRGDRGETWGYRLVTAARTARPVPPPADSRPPHSPTVRDGLAWLTGRYEQRR